MKLLNCIPALKQSLPEVSSETKPACSVLTCQEHLHLLWTQLVFPRGSKQETCYRCPQVFVEENADVKSGFAVRMQFAENPYFSNSELAKRMDFLEDGSVKLSSNPPQWHPGKVWPSLQLQPSTA